MSPIPTVLPAAPPATYFTMGGWSPGGLILATGIVTVTVKVLALIGTILSRMVP